MGENPSDQGSRGEGRYKLTEKSRGLAPRPFIFVSEKREQGGAAGQESAYGRDRDPVGNELVDIDEAILHRRRRQTEGTGRRDAANLKTAIDLALVELIVNRFDLAKSVVDTHSGLLGGVAESTLHNKGTVVKREFGWRLFNAMVCHPKLRRAFCRFD